MNKYKCCKCNKIAVWCYLPTAIFYCDEHVPRGCYCNSRHIKEDGNPDNENFIWLDDNHTLYEYLDEKGRRSPCCEYDYDENGFEID